MRTEIITEDLCAKYLKILSNEEIFALGEGRMSVMGAYDEESGEAAAVMAVQILPRHILIERIFTLPEYRKKGAATALLSYLKDLPEDLALPVYLVTHRTDADTEFLLKRGFSESKSRFFFLAGKLGDMDIPENTGDLSCDPIEKVPYVRLYEYSFKDNPDTFLQLPELVLDMDRFSDGSICCRRGREVCGMMLMEEPDDGIQISFLRYDDEAAAEALFSEASKLLKEEYGPEADLRFLLCGDEEKDTIGKFFRYSEEQPIRIFRLKMED
ncbi:MAG: GNAT family N-acetyltransferase [Lachnospiraceae bacterium]|nr:GNAT family N-acetyltransferase [Lachnospiraceae bacterium]